MADIRSIYCYFHNTLSERFNDFRDRPYAMFHSQTSQVIKEHIINSFSNSDGHVRILIATIAFGMGVDCKGLNTVVHFGPPSTVEDYYQETGRAGRNGKPSFAILINFSGCTRGTSMQDEMKLYIRNNSICRRSLLLKVFGKVNMETRRESCCDICAMGVSKEECFGVNNHALSNAIDNNIDSEDSEDE